jgi:F420-dependent oxidoreductase-like protein
MRFGLSTAPQNCTWEQVLALWKAADDMEVFESAWTFDHFYPIFSDPTGPCLEGWATLAALLQATRRLRGGCMVTGMVYRHPTILANMAATVDVMSAGRLELGLGAAWNEEECDAYGIPLGTLTERFDRFEEGVAIIHGMLTQTTTTFEGRYYAVTDARCEPKSVQEPHPPIVIGGVGERRTLPMVAKWADHWNAARATPDELRHKLGLLDELCAAEGRDRKEITVSVSLFERDPSRVADVAASYAEAGADAAIVRPEQLEVGLLEPLAVALEPLLS